VEGVEIHILLKIPILAPLLEERFLEKSKGGFLFAQERGGAGLIIGERDEWPFGPAMVLE
jgi:hypothetical protein